MTLPRQEEIPELVRRGRAAFTWVPLPGYPVEVMADALKIDGLRVPVSAWTAQHVADVIGDGAQLSTPLLEDLIYQAAVVKVRPAAYSPAEGSIASEPAVLRFNESIERQLGPVGPGTIVASVGKAWVLDERTRQHPGRACNYGWHVPGGPLRAVTPGLRVNQDPGWAHNLWHWDYSQTCRLVRPLPGATVPSHAPLTLTRQPGVPELRITGEAPSPEPVPVTPPATPPATGGSRAPQVPAPKPAPSPQNLVGALALLGFAYALVEGSKRR